MQKNAPFFFFLDQVVLSAHLSILPHARAKCFSFFIYSNTILNALSISRMPSSFISEKLHLLSRELAVGPPGHKIKLGQVSCKKYQRFFVDQACGRGRRGSASLPISIELGVARLCGITPPRQGSRPWGKRAGECARAHLRAKGLCQLVSRNDPQSCTLAPTRDRVGRSSARRNRIKSGIATRFEILPGVWRNRGKESAGVNICMNEPTAEANFLNKRAPFALPGESADIIRLISEEMVRGAGERRRRTEKNLRQLVAPIHPATRTDGKYIIAITPFNPIQYARDVIERRAPRGIRSNN